MPASENIRIVRMVAITGLVADRPDSSPISSTLALLRRIARMTAKVPSVITM